MNPTQLFNPADRSFTYILFDEASRDALLLDPHPGELARDLATLRRMNVKLALVLATSGTSPQTQAAKSLAEPTGARVWQADGPGPTWTVTLGQTTVQILATPGYTEQSVCVYWEQTQDHEPSRPGLTLASSPAPAATGRTHKRHLFTGLTLLIGNSRPPVSAWNAQQQLRSVQERLFSLPGTTIVWPGRDDHQRSQSTVAVEKSFNPQFRPSGDQPAATAEPELVVQPADGYAGDLPPQLAYAWMQGGDAVLVDVRTDAERAWVGRVPQALPVAWKLWPGMVENPNFDAELRNAVPPGKKVLMLCRSGVRSVAAAKRATELGYEAYNVLEGFEGDLDAAEQRGRLGGWRLRGLPWVQS